MTPATTPKDRSEFPASGEAPVTTRNRPEVAETNLTRIIDGFCKQSNLNARVHYFLILAEWTRSGSRSSSFPNESSGLMNCCHCSKKMRSYEYNFNKLFMQCWGKAMPRRMVERVLPSARGCGSLKTRVQA